MKGIVWPNNVDFDVVVFEGSGREQVAKINQLPVAGHKSKNWLGGKVILGLDLPKRKTESAILKAAGRDREVARFAFGHLLELFHQLFLC